jgi:peptidoglycan/LPS O-acetylase OafA/YrhL
MCHNHVAMSDDFFKNNAIGFLRFGLALAVILQHGAPPGYTLDPLGLTGWEILPGYPLEIGNVAVVSFFFLSGLLIARSWNHAPSAARFLWHRFLRIFPAFWVCLVLSAFALGPILFYADHRNLGDYFQRGPADPYRYVYYNLFLRINQYRIRYLFEGNPTTEVNISLWTLATEFACYLLPVAFCLLRRRILRWAAGIIIAVFFLVTSAGADWQVGGRALGDLCQKYLPGIVSLPSQRYWVVFFLVGMMTHAGCSRVKLSAPAAWAALAVTALASSSRLGAGIMPLTWSYFLLWAAAALPFRTFDRKVDLSYGMYIFGYPVQQTLVWADVARYGVATHVALAVAVPILLAFLSWHLVERPALRLKNVSFFREPRTK